ncbi:MAG: hypothetical protein EPN75_04990 [Beijerinckiaceae bacterium]|nr:MAG: hypothetical protein EPN75_04990 [Beijerinckiaceae bacterium]
MLRRSPARGERLFCDEDGEGRPDRAADNAVCQSHMLECVEIGVVARPRYEPMCALGRQKIPHDVTAGSRMQASGTTPATISFLSAGFS